MPRIHDTPLSELGMTRREYEVACAIESHSDMSLLETDRTTLEIAVQIVRLYIASATVQDEIEKFDSNLAWTLDRVREHLA